MMCQNHRESGNVLIVQTIIHIQNLFIRKVPFSHTQNYIKKHQTPSMTVQPCQNSHSPFPISPDLMLPSHCLHFTSFKLLHLHTPVPLSFAVFTLFTVHEEAGSVLQLVGVLR